MNIGLTTATKVFMSVYDLLSSDRSTRYYLELSNALPAFVGYELALSTAP